MFNDPKIHSSLLALVGGYLIYLAYEMFTGMRDGSSDMNPVLNIVFIVFFVLAGIAVLVYAAVEWKNRNKKKEEPPKNEGNSLK